VFFSGDLIGLLFFKGVAASHWSIVNGQWSMVNGQWFGVDESACEPMTIVY